MSDPPEPLSGELGQVASGHAYHEQDDRGDEMTGGDAVDRDTLDVLAFEMQDGDIVLDVVAAYLGQLPSRRDGIVEAAETGDLATLADLAHALRSSSAMLGAGPLGTLAGDLEGSARSGDLATVRVLVAPLVPECARVESSLRAWRPA